MASKSAPDSRLPWVGGAALGVLAWILGYVFTYLIVAPDVRRSPLQQIIETFGGDPATYEMVGWVFFNAHFVDTVFRNVPIIGGRTFSFIGGENGFTVLLYLVPIGMLLASGIALARYNKISNGKDGALVGLTVIPGYFLLSIAGVFVFEVTVATISGAPDAVPAIVLAGVVYPVLFSGGSGGIVGALTGTASQTKAP